MEIDGLIHAHSTHSHDGTLSLRELRALLVAEGLAFACMTEHTDELTPDKAAAFVAECRALSDGAFVFVPGFEVPYGRAHMLALGATDFVCSFADAERLRAWREVAPLMILAHPARNAYAVDTVMAELIDGVEIWNQQYDGRRAPRIRAYRLLEDLRRARPELLATGGPDFHRIGHRTFPRLRLDAASLTEAALLDALREGRFQFGNGAHAIAARGAWADARLIRVRAESSLSVLVIAAGKFVNRALARAGLSLPKTLKRAVRSRV